VVTKQNGNPWRCLECVLVTVLKFLQRKMFTSWASNSAVGIRHCRNSKENLWLLNGSKLETMVNIFILECSEMHCLKMHFPHEAKMAVGRENDE
jgi:hypothetical protein